MGKQLDPHPFSGEFVLRIVYFSGEEIDGATLISLSDYMIAQLFPTMKLQVKFQKCVKLLTNETNLPQANDWNSWKIEGTSVVDSHFDTRCFILVTSIFVFPSL